MDDEGDTSEASDSENDGTRSDGEPSDVDKVLKTKPKKQEEDLGIEEKLDIHWPLWEI